MVPRAALRWRSSRGGSLWFRPAPEWRNWHTRSTQNRLPLRGCGVESHLRHRQPRRGPHFRAYGRQMQVSSGWQRRVAAARPGAVFLARADRPLLLDVPLLAEAVEGGSDEDDLQQTEEDDQETDQRGGQQ